MMDTLHITFDPDVDAYEAVLSSATPDGRILGFNLMVSVVAALGFGLIPALQAAGTDLVSTIKQQSSSASAGHGALTVRSPRS